MREILFRGKQCDNGEWIEGFYLLNKNKNKEENYIFDGNCSDGVSLDYYDIDKNTLGQYTGLLDKNGKKIFEGDILRLCKSTYPCLIYWSGIGWAIKRNGKRVQYAYGCDLISDCEKMQIIGNIYDNPKLLEE